MTLIQFKSIPVHYNKERLGLKSNTIRQFDDEEDPRKIILDKYISSEIKEYPKKKEISSLFIKIINTQTNESFKKYVTDVTYSMGVYIISWG